ncbi:MAG: LacI family DNA-binding transcriptional regulator [Acetivibrionales bacterium]|nr:LacI family transcriptional regulator [Clostridiaceae bacterium]
MTLKEIAKEAGVSVSTVSRVINKKGAHVARPEIQNKIWEIVSRAGYVPNKNAQNLRKNVKTAKSDGPYPIACLFARTPESINDPFFSKLACSVEAAAFEANYNVRYSLTEIDMKSIDTLHTINDMNIRGVVVLGRCDKVLLKYLKQNFRFVSYTGLNPTSAKYDQIICDGREVGEAAVDYLVSLGHEKIAYIGETSNENRFEGYQAALKKHGLEFEQSYVVNVPLSSENGYRGATKLLERANGVTAVLAANDITAIGAMRAMREKGIRIPQDMSIIGIDDIDMAQYMATKLTSVHIPVEEMGQLATKTLIDRINGGHTLPLKISLPFYIAERESCGKPPKVPKRKTSKKTNKD